MWGPCPFAFLRRTACASRCARGPSVAVEGCERRGSDWMSRGLRAELAGGDFHSSGALGCCVRPNSRNAVRISPNFIREKLGASTS
ncbi:Protein of unknown function [Gryllus bimaculatus]|nr:Protein of unknown function [Gryllus bimaculatus]